MSDGQGERQGAGGLVHRLFQWGFIGFNGLMAVWLVSYIVSAGRLKATALTAAEKAAAGDAVALGAGMLLGVWLFGAVLLRLLAGLTKPRRP